MNNDFDDNNNSHIDIDDYDNKDNHLQITFTYPIHSFKGILTA